MNRVSGAWAAASCAWILTSAVLAAAPDDAAATSLTAARAGRLDVHGVLSGCLTELWQPRPADWLARLDPNIDPATVDQRTWLTKSRFVCQRGRFRADSISFAVSDPGALTVTAEYVPGDGTGYAHEVTYASAAFGGPMALGPGSNGTCRVVPVESAWCAVTVERTADLVGAFGFHTAPSAAALAAGAVLPEGARLVEDVRVGGRTCVEVRWTGEHAERARWFASDRGYACVREEAVGLGQIQTLKIVEAAQLAEVDGLGWVPAERLTTWYERPRGTAEWTFLNGSAVWLSDLEMSESPPDFYSPWYPNGVTVFEPAGGATRRGVDTRTLVEAAARGEYPFDTQGQPRVMLLEEGTE